MSKFPVNFTGFDRIMVSPGEAVPVTQALRMDVIPDIGFRRHDGWSIGAPSYLESEAYATWPDEWTHFIRRPDIFWVEIKEYKEQPKKGKSTMEEMRPINVVVIDSEKRELRDAVVGSLKEMQDLVGGRIEVVQLPYGDLYVNEEFLFMGYENGFRIQGWEEPILGNAFLAGHLDDEGDSTNCPLKALEVKPLITNWIRVEMNDEH